MSFKDANINSKSIWEKQGNYYHVNQGNGYLYGLGRVFEWGGTYNGRKWALDTFFTLFNRITGVSLSKIFWTACFIHSSDFIRHLKSFFKSACLGGWGLRDWVSDPLYSYLYFIFWIFKERFFRTRFLVISFPSSQPFHWSSSATSMPQMTLFFTFFCFFGKHTWVSMGLAGCSVGREKEGRIIGVGLKDPEKKQRSPHF